MERIPTKLNIIREYNSVQFSYQILGVIFLFNITLINLYNIRVLSYTHH